MFEKEAIIHAFEETIGIECLNKPVEDFTYEELSDELQEKAYDFKKGAEFGFNNANKWHYVKDGDLPKENQEVLVFFSLPDKSKNDVAIVCFKNNDFDIVDLQDVICWKEIILPKGFEK